MLEDGIKHGGKDFIGDGSRSKISSETCVSVRAEQYLGRETLSNSVPKKTVKKEILSLSVTLSVSLLVSLSEPFSLSILKQNSLVPC